MSMTGLEVFDTTVHKTNTWLKDLMAELGWQDKHKTYLALRVTLHALRDRLTVEEAAQLGAQLPMLMRGFYYEGWRPADTPRRERHREEFLSHIAAQFTEDPVDPAHVAHSVFMLLFARVSTGEIEDVEHMLPSEIRDLWPALK
jgi:uncharacterized protein (DUF2267 family)